jgi:hypothetical protein
MMSKSIEWTSEQLDSPVWVPNEGFVLFGDMTSDQHRTVIKALEEVRDHPKLRSDLEALRVWITMQSVGHPEGDMRDWNIFSDEPS